MLSFTRSRARLSMVALAATVSVALVLSGCTGAGTTAQTPVGGTAPVTTDEGSSGASSGRPTVTVPDMGTTTDSSSSATSTTTTMTTTTSTPEPAPAAEWTTVTPAAAAVDVSPADPVVLAVGGGVLQGVELTNSDGKLVAGALSPDSTTWTSAEPLGYGKTYSVAAVAANAEGAPTTQSYQFTTLTPGNKTLATAFPTDGMTVGVGQSIKIYFDEKIADKAATEQLIHIATAPNAVEGAFYWVSDKEVHWRPKDYWPANTSVDVNVQIYGRTVGNGIFGQEDKHFAFTIGQSKIATVDDNTHTMTIVVDGQQVMSVPVSLGRNKYPTQSGVHVVQEKYTEKTMDSSTWGLTGAGAYVTDVKWATRISNSGEFVHAAPWSVSSQGKTNVSHGCINVSTANAKWFYENFGYGDVVDIKNTVGGQLPSWDAAGDWQVPWEEWVQGGKRA